MILSNTLGVSTLLCPCDSDPYNEDAACNTTGAYNRLAWQYGYSTSCIEMDLNHDQFIEHSMAMLLS